MSVYRQKSFGTSIYVFYTNSKMLCHYMQLLFTLSNTSWGFTQDITLSIYFIFFNRDIVFHLSPVSGLFAEL